MTRDQAGAGEVGRAGQGSAAQDSAGHGSAQDSAAQSSADRSRSGHSSAAQSSADRSSAGHGSADHSRTDHGGADHGRAARAGQRRPASGAAASRLAAAAEDAARRWPLSRITGLGVLLLAAFAIAAIAVGAITLGNQSSDRSRLVDTLDPAALHASQLSAGLLDQETGLRGYLLSGSKPFLGPYYAGLTQQQSAVSDLRRLLVGMPSARADLAKALSRASTWRTAYAMPSIRAVAATGKPLLSPNVAAGRNYFDAVRSPLAALQDNLTAQRTSALSALHTSATVLDVTSITIAVALLLVVTFVAIWVRAAAINPLTRLAAEARRVAGGEFEHEVDPSGPREVHDLAVDVNRMRERILRELSAVRGANATLEARAHELERSNAELEQFAYVASHDLQEPLRKVASFCQLLQRRYIGQLDARADQYIEFAVDGAKRMQALIDDLLAFSRVGRSQREPAQVSCASALSQARTNLAADIRRCGATVSSSELPVVRAEFSLITSLFQNLVGNAIKFRSDEPPRVTVSAEREGDFWLFAVTDNGIGIDPEFAERIFVIFQRLHDRSTYAGTGIGLAMCRKIVEHYGGAMWLDTSFHDGARFRFTLPASPNGDNALEIEETTDE
jgi:signal transduction histidine kinase